MAPHFVLYAIKRNGQADKIASVQECARRTRTYRHRKNISTSEGEMVREAHPTIRFKWASSRQMPCLPLRHCVALGRFRSRHRFLLDMQFMRLPGVVGREHFRRRLGRQAMAA